MATNKNPIWNFYDRKDGMAKCKFCKKNMSLGNVLPKKQTTVSIKRHLEINHPEEYTKFCEQVANQQAEKPAPINLLGVQLTLPNFIEKNSKEYWADDSIVAKNIDKSIMDLILVDMLPYNLVEGTAFKKLNFADPEKFGKYKKKKLKNTSEQPLCQKRTPKLEKRYIMKYKRQSG